MKVKYQGDAPAWLPGIPLNVAPGEVVDVPDEVGEELLQRDDWAKPKPAKESGS